MATAYIGLGSNLPFEGATSADLLASAVEALTTAGRLVACSSLYATEPVGYAGQPPFLNAVIALETDAPPAALLALLLATERRFGRDRLASIPNGPRTLDLDLLLYGRLVLQTEQLTLPHPRLSERRFVLAPLAEIAPALLHPQLDQSMQQLLRNLPQAGENGPEAVRREPATPDFPSTFS